MKSLRNELIFIDLETTGLNPDCDKIIEIAAVWYEANGSKNIYQKLIDPEVEIPEFISRLTGIDNAMVDYAPRAEEIVKEVDKLFENKIIVAHNARFDVSFLEKLLSKKLDNKIIDTLDLCKLVFPEFDSYALRSIAAFFGFATQSDHRALSDVEILISVYDIIYENIKNISITVLEELKSLLWHEKYALSFPFAEVLNEKISNNYEIVFDKKPSKQFTEIVRGTPKKNLSWDISAMEKMLIRGGEISNSIDGYEERKSQIIMMKAVAKSFQQSRHLIVEAGTGVGKSMAYLLPAVLWSLTQDEKVIIAAHTIALQEQLLNKEAVFLKYDIDLEFKTAVLKGRSNYFCMSKWLSYKSNAIKYSWNERIFTARICIWLSREHAGDRDYINLNDWENDIYMQLSSTAESCLGKGCPNINMCFYDNAKQAAHQANVVIVNHSLLLADLKNAESILPVYSFLIIDEAHNLLDEGKKQFSEIFSLREYAKNIVFIQKKLAKSNNNHIQRINEIIREIREYHLAEGMTDSILISQDKTGEKWWSHLRASCENLVLNTTYLLEEIILMEEDQKAYNLKKVHKQIKNSIDIIKRFFNDMDETKNIYWIEKNVHSMEMSFIITPNNTEEYFSRLLFNAKESIILTSATMSVEDSFTYQIKHLGIPDELIDCKILTSPFFYSEQSITLVDTSMPDPGKTSDAIFNIATADALLNYLKIVGGGTLVLFTSRKQIIEVFDILYKELKNIGLDLFADGINGRRQILINEMKKNPNAVIFGARAFWEGIDLPGESLRTLIMVRLPFDPPTIPLTKAIMKEYASKNKDGFTEYCLPRAILRFRQGFGRLIRTQNDRGVFIVLDKRLITKLYGRAFINSLPQQEYLAGDTATLVERISSWFHNGR